MTNKLSDYIWITAVYILCMATVLFVLDHYLFPNLLRKDHLLQHDALLYQEIATEGYEGFKMAFFPLFPKVWGVFGFNVTGIAILNAIIYFVSLIFFARELNPNRLEFLFMLAVPAAVFYYVPYSEAMFFGGGVLLLVGLKKDLIKFVLAGLFLCTLTRPAFSVLIPALFLSELMLDKPVTRKMVRLALFTGTTLLAVVIVAIIQYIDTGEWFRFFQMQAVWGNELQIPEFPLRSWGEEIVARYDGLALLVGIICSALVIHKIYQKIVLKKAVSVKPELFFSMLYLAGIAFAVLFFRGGSLFSLNRFVFATPFFLVVLFYYLSKDFRIKPRVLLIAGVSLLLFWLLFGAYVHIVFFIKFILLTIFCLLILALKLDTTSKIKALRAIVLLILFVFQTYLIIRYLDGYWIA